MYNPADPTAAEIAAGYDDSDDFEFIEIKNISSQTLVLNACASPTASTSPSPTAPRSPPGAYKVAVRNQAAFLYRYSTVSPSVIAGVYTGNLSNAGETIGLDAPVGGRSTSRVRGRVVRSYRRRGLLAHHPRPAGRSGPVGHQRRLARQRRPRRTPGSDDTLAAPGAVIVNEVLAHQDAALGDMVELYNTTGRRSTSAAGSSATPRRTSPSTRLRPIPGSRPTATSC